MGRVSRYKKISKDDPFAPRRPKEVDETIDHAPEGKDELDDGGGMTRTALMVMKAQERMRRDQEKKRFDSLSDKAKARPVNKLPFDHVSVAQKSASLEFTKDQHKPKMDPQFEPKKDDETYHEFTARLRGETKERTKQRVLADTHKQEKRKDYYERKREAKRKRQHGDNSDDELDEQEGRIADFSKLQDKSRPVFGEQAQAPPKFTVLPKHASKVDLAIAKRVKAAGIQASSPMVAFKEKKKLAIAKLADIDPQYASSISAPSSLPASSIDQSEAKRREIESLREKVQAQYKKLKETRIAEKRNSITAASDKTLHRKKKSQKLNFSEDDMERFQAMMPESKASVKKQRREERRLKHSRH